MINHQIQNSRPRSSAGVPPGSSEVKRFETRASRSQTLVLFFGLLFSALPTTPAVQAQRVLINEIHYHPASQNDRDEYIELYNSGDSTVDLQGWRFTDGIDFVLPAISIEPGDLVVVAADRAAFQQAHPDSDTAKLVGGWTGHLSNSSEAIVLRNHEGALADELVYADEGQWGRRQRGPLDRQHRGWEWAAPHDGGGASLELRNPSLTNDHGHNWSASQVDGGTPGEPNSVWADDVSPLIGSVVHRPAVPTSSDAVQVSVRVVDERPDAVATTLAYRIDGGDASQFETIPMTPVASSADPAQGRRFQAEIPAQPNNTIVEFFIEARDADGSERRWPPPVRLPDGSSAQAANLLYQVDNSAYGGNQPLYKLIMTGAERAELDAIGSAPLTGAANSNAQMNGTFISTDGTGTKIRYLVGIRNRGQGSRNRQPNNYRVNFRSDIPWNDQTALNLNAQYSYAQHIGAVLSLHAGVPSGFATAVQLRVNNDDATLSGSRNRTYGSYVAKEALNSEFADRHFPEDSGGNLYKGFRNNQPADLGYRGPDYNAYTNSYSKDTNTSENDWSDLIELTRTLNNAPDSDYTHEAKRVAAVRQWMRYFALMALVNNRESSLYTGFGDDYFLYRGEADRRFRLVSHDLDTILGEGDTRGSTEAAFLGKNTIFAAITMPAFDRLLRWPPFSRLYYRQLIDLNETLFPPQRFNPLIQEILGGYVPQPVIQRMQDWLLARRKAIRDLIPRSIEVASELSTKDGFFYTTEPSITLRGRANALKTDAVRVNGNAAAWTAFKGEWEKANVTLQPGINSVLIQSLDRNGSEFERKTLPIWYETASTTTVKSDLTQDARWSPEQGPYLIERRITVSADATLTIQPGTTVYFQPGAGIDVKGRLVAVGNDSQRIRLSTTPNSGTTWGGIAFLDTNNDNRLAFVDIRSTASGHAAVSARRSILQIRHSSWDNIGGRAVEASLSSLEIRRCNFGSQSRAMIYSEELLPSDPFLKIVGSEFGEITGSDKGAVFHRGIPESDTVIQLRRNRFKGGGSPAIRLESAKAYIHANRFRHFKGGNGPVHSIVADINANPHLVRNIFFDNDYSLLINRDSFATLEYNTVVRSAISAIDFHGDETLTPGDGVAISGTIFADNGSIFEDVYRDHPTRDTTQLEVDYSLLPTAYHDFGEQNVAGPPLFVAPPSDFHLRPGSPAIDAGPNGNDMGAQVPDGPRITGEPSSGTPKTEAILTVRGPGLTHYRYRLDQNAPSQAIPISEPIVLSDLEAGWHEVHVVGRDVAGVWHDKGETTASARWKVDPTLPSLQINELLARNDSIRHNGRLSDLVELHNQSDSAINLSGYRLTDDLSEPSRFVFPEGVTLPGGNYMVLQASDDTEGPGLHLGFALDGDGEALYLFDRPDNGGRRLDSVEFGPQITDFSIGRLPQGGWGLTRPTLGKPNIPQPLGNPKQLVINEWLTDTRQSGFEADFVEIRNQALLPVALGNLALTDSPNSSPERHSIAPLSFIPANGYRVFIADGEPQRGAHHLDFKLSPDSGMLALFQQGGREIDRIVYGPQTTDVSQGPKETGKGLYRNLPEPTPGIRNPQLTDDPGQSVILNEVAANDPSELSPTLSEAGWVELYNPGADAVELHRLSLTDQLSTPDKWTFPEGSQLAAGEYLVIRLDADAAPSEDNAGFNLDRHGDSLYLLKPSADGVQAIDSISFGPQPKGLSIGRNPDESSEWQLSRPTPVLQNRAVQLDTADALKVNEWMARPDTGDDWLELYNPAASPVDISGFFLTDDPDDPEQYQLPPLSFIGANAFLKFEADDRPSAGATHLNFRLSGDGEAIRLSNREMTAIDIIRFDEQADGISEGRLPDGHSRTVRFRNTPTPEASNYLPLNLRINEVLSNTQAPLEDAIELFNPTDSPIEIGGWHVSDSTANLKKYRIPTADVIPANGFYVIYEHQLDDGPGSMTPFDLSALDDDAVYLSEATQNGDLSGRRANFPLMPTTDRTSLGRYVTGGGAHVARLSQPTFGRQHPLSLSEFRQGQGNANAYPVTSPLVVNEIMYHPSELGSQDNASQFEFVELQNLRRQNFSVGGTAADWRLEGGIRFDLPTGLTLPPSGSLIVVSFDPSEDSQALADFKHRYDLSSEAVIVGPYDGNLSNAGEKVILARKLSAEESEHDELSRPVYVSMDRVDYSDDLPWPPEADGEGASLHRSHGWLYPNDPAHWRSNTPTPGIAEPEMIGADRDNDGIPSQWEVSHGLDPADSTDGTLDADQDGQSNRQEYIAGTHPWDARSRVAVSSIHRTGDTVTITFTAVAGRSYTLLRTSSLASSSWTERKQLAPQETTRQIEFHDSVDGEDRAYFYRLQTARP